LFSVCALVALLSPETPAGETPVLEADPALADRGQGVVVLWTRSEPDASRLAWTSLRREATDSSAVWLTPPPSTGGSAAVAADSTWGLAVWVTWSAATGYEIRGSELPLAEPETQAPPIAIRSGAAPVHRPAVALAADRAVVVWEDGRSAPGDLFLTVWVRSLGPQGVRGGTPLAVGPADQRTPRVAARPDGFLVVWSEGPEAGPRRVFGLRLDSHGVPRCQAFALSGAGDDATWPDVAAAAGGFQVVWTQPGTGGGAVAGCRVADSTTPPAVLVDSPAFDFGPRVAGCAGGSVLVWHRSGMNGRALRRGLLDISGRLHPAAGVTLTSPREHAADPALAVSADTAWIAWRLPDPDDEDDLYVVRVAAADTSAVPDPVLLTRADPGATTGLLPPRPRAVLGAYPNPFRNGVVVHGVRRMATLRVLDARGRLVRVLSGRSPAVRWNGRDEAGREVPPGVYWVTGGERGVRVIRLP
jgi:hypothetical protein